MSTAADTRGLKRICTECGARFYDLNKRPITCPGCETEFTGEIKAKTRRGRVAAADATPAKKEKAAAAKEVSNDDDTEVKAEEDVVSLEGLKEEGADGEEEIALGDADMDDLGAGVEKLDDDEEDDLSADIDIKQSSDE